MKRVAFVAALAAVAVAALAGCPEPRDRPDVRCADACQKRIVGCSEHQCQRGCAFVLDRLVEHEQDTVLSCVAKAKKCEDEQWAGCAARVGAHADGGPPAPTDLPPDEPPEL
jgi:hypothetical protein